jgi:PKD repeat protein
LRIKKVFRNAEALLVNDAYVTFSIYIRTVEGINYVTASQSGKTNSLGEFSYYAGETVNFFLGNLPIGIATGKELLHLYDLSGTDNQDGLRKIRIGQLLQSLDRDGDVSNGIDVSRISGDKMLSNSMKFDGNQAEFDEQLKNLLVALSYPAEAFVDFNKAKTHLDKTSEEILAQCQIPAPVTQDGRIKNSLSCLDRSKYYYYKNRLQSTLQSKQYNSELSLAVVEETFNRENVQKHLDNNVVSNSLDFADAAISSLEDSVKGDVWKAFLGTQTALQKAVLVIVQNGLILSDDPRKSLQSGVEFSESYHKISEVIDATIQTLTTTPSCFALLKKFEEDKISLCVDAVHASISVYAKTLNVTLAADADKTIEKQLNVLLSSMKVLSNAAKLATTGTSLAKRDELLRAATASARSMIKLGFDAYNLANEQSTPPTKGIQSFLSDFTKNTGDTMFGIAEKCIGETSATVGWGCSKAVIDGVSKEAANVLVAASGVNIAMKYSGQQSEALMTQLFIEERLLFGSDIRGFFGKYGLSYKYDDGVVTAKDWFDLIYEVGKTSDYELRGLNSRWDYVQSIYNAVIVDSNSYSIPDVYREVRYYLGRIDSEATDSYLANHMAMSTTIEGGVVSLNIALSLNGSGAFGGTLRCYAPYSNHTSSSPLAIRVNTSSPQTLGPFYFSRAGMVGLTCALYGATGRFVEAKTIVASVPSSASGISIVSSPASPKVGEIMTFSVNVSSAPNGPIQSYAWKFGDGSIGSMANQFHTYKTQGTYIVELTVTNEKGIASTTSQAVVIAPATPPTVLQFTDSFNGASLDATKWNTISGAGGIQYSGTEVTFGGGSYATTQSKVTFGGSKIVVEGRFVGSAVGRDTHMELIDTANGHFIQIGDTNYSDSFYLYGSGSSFNGVDSATRILTSVTGSTSAYMDYRLTVEGSTAKIERSISFADTTKTVTTKTVTLPTSIVGRTFYLRIGTGALVDGYSPGTFDSVSVSVTP